ncbi:MAG TPA: preprotein translocase subunit SecE [Actinomycetes bacterium]|jgi:preprotein translocase subunit SecE|nr:preprotein translocase subunit SecE [Actinomycetes bacterium]
MNRETKRAMARQQRSADTGERLQQLRKQQLSRQQAPKQTRDGQAPTRRFRLRGIGSFGGEVTSELRKVNWPDRRTVFGYTVVVLVAVTAITAAIFVMDTLFGKAVLAIFGR